MPKYIKCPRCELNWIPEDEQYCDVCKAELHMGGKSLLEDDEDEEERLCPICRRNYLEDGEKYCSECREKKLAKSDDSDYDTDLPARNDEEMEVSFDEIEREENWAIDDESFDDNDDFSSDDFADDDIDLDDTDDEESEEEEDEESAPVEDIEDDFDYDADDIDVDDEDDEEDEEDGDEDEDY